jgi:hypothetical protein
LSRTTCPGFSFPISQLHNNELPPPPPPPPLSEGKCFGELDIFLKENAGYFLNDWFPWICILSQN